MISREEAEAVTDAFESAAIAAGANKDMYKLFGSLLDLFKDYQNHLEALRSREAMISLVQSFSAEDEALISIIGTIFALVPVLAKQGIKQMAKEFAGDNPILKQPGRPTVLDEKIKRKICSETLEMFGDGVQLTTAQERVAERLGISVRTVRGVWRNRHLLSKNPQSLTDIFQIISAL